MPNGNDLGAIGVTLTGGQIQGVAGAGSVVIENFTIYNRAPEEPDAHAADGEPIGPCPYPGLDYFGPDDAARFFGRDAAIDRLTTAVSRQSFTALAGASGSGKSSVVLAGLAPRLHGLGGWRFSRFRIGNELEHNPFLALARALAPLFTPSTDDLDRLTETRRLATLLQSGELALRDVFAASRGRDKGSCILLIADQFEETFTLVEDETLRHRFIDVLLAGFPDPARSSSPDVSLILTMRADFYGRALLYRPLADALQGHVENLGPMSRDELRLAIETPAKNEKVSFESGLVETLLHDVESKPGSLPLLQFALREMWGRQERRKIARNSYDAIGGVQGALARRAEAIFAEMTENGANARIEAYFQRLFTRLVTPGEGQEDTRRIAERRELGDEVWSLAQRLAGEANRLIVTSVSGPTQETAELVHEALIHNWPTLAGWISRDRAFLFWLRQIKPNLELWLADEADDGALLRGGMLAQARDWFARRGDDLSPEERRYVEASLALRQWEDEQREAAREAEIAHERELAEAAGRLAREQGRRAKIAAVGVVVAFLLAAFGGWKTLEANRSAELAQAGHLAGQARRADLEATSADEVERAAALALESIAKSDGKGTALPEADAIEAARSTLSRLPLVVLLQGSRVSSMAWLPDGRLASGGDDGTIKLWPKDGTGAPIALFQGSRVSSMAWLPDGRLASGGDDGKVKLWPKDGSDKPEKTLSLGSPILSMLLLPNGGLVCAGNNHTGTIKLWPKNDGKPVLFSQGSRISSLAVLADGRLASAGNDDNGTIKLWPTDGTGTPLILPHGGPVSSLAVLADGRLASAGDDDNGTIKLWPTGGTDMPVVLSHGAPVLSLGVLADGRLASGGEDGKIKLWPKEGTGEPVILSHGSPVSSLFVLADGRLASASDGKIILWPKDGKGEPMVLFGNGGMSPPVLANGRLVSSDEDGTIRLWPSQDTAEPLVLSHGSQVNSLAVVRDGRLASGGSDGKVKLWPKEGAGMPVVLSQGSPVLSLAVLAGGRLASGGSDGKIKLWPEDGKGEPAILSQDSPVLSLVVLEDSRLASGSSDGKIKLWPKEGTGEPLVLSQGSQVRSLAVLADGRLASGGRDGKIKLWPKDGKGEPAVLSHGSPILSLAVLADGRLASGGSDGKIKLWPKEGTGAYVVLSHGGQVFSLAVLADGRLASGGGDGKIKLWPKDFTGEPEIISRGSRVMSLGKLANGRVASGAEDGEIKLWLVDKQKLIAALCLRAGRNLSRDEWARYIGSDSPWEPSCHAISNWRTVAEKAAPPTFPAPTLPSANEKPPLAPEPLVAPNFDPSVKTQVDRAASLNKMGDAKRAQGNLVEALTIYLAAHDICHRLANEDPSNVGLQQEHSVSHNKIGDVYLAQHDLPEAITAYQAALGIRESLVKADPGNAGGQRDLSVSHNKIGNVLEAQGNLPAALDSYRAGLAIIARLAKTQPGTAGFQHDLAVSYSHVAMVEARQGDRADALAKFRQGRDSITWLIQQSPDDPTFSNELAWFDQQIADLPK